MKRFSNLEVNCLEVRVYLFLYLLSILCYLVPIKYVKYDLRLPRVVLHRCWLDLLG